MNLKLTDNGEIVYTPCQACNGSGKIKHEDWQRKDGRWVHGGGYLPCPDCKGKKVVYNQGK